jgi:hypothetical protein
LGTAAEEEQNSKAGGEESVLRDKTIEPPLGGFAYL